MNLRLPFLLALAFGLVACSKSEHLQPTINDIQIYAPLSGQNSGVGYLMIENRTASDAQIERISSPQFEKIEIHETTLIDGVTKMRRLPSLEVNAQSVVEFSPGGLHLMLVNPAEGVRAGTTVTLEFEVAETLLIVTAPLQDRPALN